MDSEEDEYEFEIDDEAGISCFQFPKDYVIMTLRDIRHQMDENIARLSGVLSVSRGHAVILLRYYNWDVGKVQDEWFADEEKVRAAVGLVENHVGHIDKRQKLTCNICFENYRHDRMDAVSCGHLFCVDCWTGYVSTAIGDGAGCLMLKCPESFCTAAVGQDMVDKLVSDKDKEKYSRYLVRSYIDESRTMKWCPAPGCECAVVFEVGGESCDVHCKCTYSFCWICTEEAHRPVDCETVAKWILKNSDESENTKWISVNSKPCPKCKRPIEKNMGCMHMTCSAPCRFEFCWVCLGSWYGHLSASCNSYKSQYREEEQAREQTKRDIQRYTHYYERWAANHSSRQKALEDLHKMQTVETEKLCHVQNISDVNTLAFIADAWQQIVECRRVLKWSYAYGFYLPEHEHAKRQLFEYLQGQAESGLERLHKCSEKELRLYLEERHSSKSFIDFRKKLINLTVVTRRFFGNLVKALENGLSDVDSQGACSKKPGRICR